MRSSLRLLALAVSPWLLCAADDAPSWLKDLTGVTLPQYPAKVNRVVLFNEEQTTAADNGRLTTTSRTAIKMLNRQGGDVVFFDSYDAPSSKVRDFRAWMISPAGKVRKYGKDEILDAACAGNDVYNECRKRMAAAGRDAEAGAIFAYESVIEYQSFTNQLNFHFQDSSPVRLARFAVTVPPGWEIKSASFNGAPREAAPSNGAYTWQMENLSAIERETASPSLLTVVPWIGVNLLGPAGRRPVLTWPEAARLLSDLNEGQADPDTAIAAKARSLVEGAASELDKIRAIGRFTQQLNYVSIQVNLSKGGGYKPHTAAQVFTKLYGDCKDKANLTRAMLKAIGITAYPVAIYSGDRTRVSQEWPSLGAFNHAISAIRIGSDTKAPAVLDHPKLGRLLLFDPTDPYVTPGYLPDHEQASLALIAAGEAGDLVRVPAATPVAAEHERRVEAQLGADGSISGKFVDKRTGEAYAEAIATYRGSGKTDYTKTIERWVGRSIAGATTTGVEVDDGRDEIVIRAQFASSRFAQRPQPRMLIFKAGLIGHGDWRLTEKSRKYSIVVDTDMLQEAVRIQLPADFKIDELPDPMKLESPFGKYEATWTAEPGAIVFERKLEMPAQTVLATQYAELKKFLDAVAGSAEMPVVLVQ